jgi:uncharacterized lipoprotein YmbA
MIRSLWPHCRAVAMPVALLTLAALAACAGAPERFFTLRPAAAPTAAVAGRSAAGFTVVVGPVSVPAWLDRPQWVLRDGDTRLQILEQQRWAQPLGSDIAQAIADQLNLAAPAPGMVAVADAGAMPLARAPALRVQVDVLRFESMATPAAAIDDSLQWSVACTAAGQGTKRVSGVFSSAPRSSSAATASAPDAGVYDQLAAAHADALRQASVEIGNAVRALAPVCAMR